MKQFLSALNKTMLRSINLVRKIQIEDYLNKYTKHTICLLFMILTSSFLSGQGNDEYSITIKAKGKDGSENINLQVGGTTVASWTLSTSYQNYTANTSLKGVIKVDYTNDNGNKRDAQIDYIVVDGTNTWQAEDQEINTGAWDGSCGAGSFTEMMHCSGYIEFDAYKNNEYSITIKAKGKAGTENINLKVGETTIASWTVSTSYQNYTANTSLGGSIKVDYTNDNGNTTHAQVDYIVVNNITWQAEDQATNTGAYQNNSCGGAYSETIDCNGYIEFGSYREVTLNAMSFNILYEGAPPNNWASERRSMVKEVILEEAPDLIGLQEVRQNQLSDLQNDLSAKYTLIMPWNNIFFGNAIGYLKTRFTLVNSGQFAYSTTPDIIKTGFGDGSRYASWAILSDNETSKSIFILSTHFYSPPEQTDSRYWSSQVLMARIQELAKGLPIIAVGDFNQQQEHESYNEITAYHLNSLTDTYRSLNPDRDKAIEGTVHTGFKEFPASTKSWRIDYIFSAHMNILDSKIIHTHFNQKYPSDHFPITTNFSYGTVPTPDPNIINSGGIIGGKDFCGSSFEAQTLSSAFDANGGCSSSNIQYQWQNRVREVCSETWGAWNDMMGATNPSSSWPEDTRDVQFRRGAKRSDCGTWQYSNIITIDLTTPVTDPGEISGSVFSCDVIDPDPLISISEASGGCGELEYMWQSRDKDACDKIWPDWKNYGQHNGLTFDPSNWNRDRQLRRGARRKGCSDWLYSNIVTIEIYDSTSNDPDCICEGNIYAIDVRAKGTQGTEVIDLIAGGTIIDSWPLSTTYQNYTAYTNLGGAIKVALKDGEGAKEAQIDYIVVDDTNTWQAENQEINTATWNDGSCGAGSYSEIMHCTGYIQFDAYKNEIHTITVRARGKDGSENINLQVGGTTITSWILSEEYEDYTTTTTLGGSIQVDYDNDNGSIRDAYIDYIVVNGTTLQAEDQATNTGVYQNSSCGGEYSEKMHCSGYIKFDASIKETVLSLNETERDYEITLYPNPINNVLTLKLFELFEKKIPISIYNVNGVVVKRIFTTDQINEINLSELQSGIYFVKVNLNNKMVVKKIIKL